MTEIKIENNLLTYNQKYNFISIFDLPFDIDGNNIIEESMRRNLDYSSYRYNIPGVDAEVKVYQYQTSIQLTGAFILNIDIDKLKKINEDEYVLPFFINESNIVKNKILIGVLKSPVVFKTDDVLTLIFN
jgi:hypothetical protein